MENEESIYSTTCDICGCKMNDFSRGYPHSVCKKCDARALNDKGEPAKHMSQYPEFAEINRKRREEAEKTGEEFVAVMPDDHGDNPIFIDGIKCWRRYRFGGWITMRDRYDCTDISEFYEKTRKPSHREEAE